MATNPNKELWRQCFKEARLSLNISQGGLAKWMYGEDTKLTRKYISRKETGTNPVSKTDLCFIRTLQALSEEGVDIKSVVFSGDDFKITTLTHAEKPNI